MDGPLTSRVKEYFNSDMVINVDRDDMLSAIEFIAEQAAIDSILDIQLDKIERFTKYKIQ